jgi:hypothetical protein
VPEQPIRQKLGGRCICVVHDIETPQLDPGGIDAIVRLGGAR